jgi:DNA-directed RNA polymerase specialized sigma24 family protein
LTSPVINRVLDSGDVSQLVLVALLSRLQAGDLEVEHQAQLLALLATLARRQTASQARRFLARRRTADQALSQSVDNVDPIDPRPNPEEQAVWRDMWSEVAQRLSAEERRVAERRGEGLEWSEIAHELGGTADGRRMQVRRALDRVAADLGLSEGAG